MNITKFLPRNKNLLITIICILILGYLYYSILETQNLVITNVSLVFIVLILLALVYYLFPKVNIIAVVLLLVISYVVIKGINLVSEPNKLKTNIYYNNSSNPDDVISNKLKASNTLEQEMVDQMVPIVKQNLGHQSPRVQAILPDTLHSAPIEE